MENEGMDLDIIINPKTTEDGQAVIQVRILLYNLHASPLTYERLLARDGCGCGDQAFQARAWHQRSAKPLLARQELLRLAPY